MRVAVIGPGRVGTAVALALPRAGHRVVAVVGRSPAALERFGARVAGVRPRGLAEAAAGADLLCIATGDAEIGDIARDLVAADALGEGHRVLHLAGSMGVEVLRPCALAGAGVAAVHPAQTVPDGAGADVFVGQAFAVTAGPGDRDWARELVADLGGVPHDVAERDRVAYHAALVLGSNAVAAAASAARQVLLATGLEDPSAFLGPLAGQSLANVLSSGAAAITGPVVRGDVATVRAHLGALDPDLPELAAAYRHLQRAVLAQVRLGLDPERAAALEQALADPAGP